MQGEEGEEHQAALQRKQAAWHALSPRTWQAAARPADGARRPAAGRAPGTQPRSQLEPIIEETEPAPPRAAAAVGLSTSAAGATDGQITAAAGGLSAAAAGPAPKRRKLKRRAALSGF